MRTAFLLVLALSLICAQSLRAQREKLSWDDRVAVEKAWPHAIKSSTGLRYLILKEGTGDARPVPGDVAAVLYQGRLLNGTVFGSASDAAKPYQVRVGRDELIAAWDEDAQTNETRREAVDYRAF